MSIFFNRFTEEIFERNFFVIVVDFKEGHKIAAIGALERIITKSQADRQTPFRNAEDEFFTVRRNGKVEMFGFLLRSGIKTVVTHHFEMFVGNMSDDPADEINGRNGFADKFIIFVAVVMKGDKFAVIMINSRGSNNRSAEITADIFDDIFRVAFVGLGIDIETVFVFTVTFGNDRFKRRTKRN